MGFKCDYKLNTATFKAVEDGDKLQEYNKIADMTNQIFEKRLCGIENAIIQISRSIIK